MKKATRKYPVVNIGDMWETTGRRMFVVYMVQGDKFRCEWSPLNPEYKPFTLHRRAFLAFTKIAEGVRLQ
jgi:hypothetical protein